MEVGKKKVVCWQVLEGARRKNKYESSGSPKRAVKGVGVETGEIYSIIEGSRQNRAIQYCVSRWKRQCCKVRWRRHCPPFISEMEREMEKMYQVSSRR